MNSPLPPIYRLGDDIWKCITLLIDTNDVNHLLRAGNSRLAAQIKRNTAELNFRVGSGFLDLCSLCNVSNSFPKLNKLSIATEKNFILPLKPLNAPQFPCTLLELRLRFKYCVDLVLCLNDLSQLAPHLTLLDLEGASNSGDSTKLQSLPSKLESLRLDGDGLKFDRAFLTQLPSSLTSLELTGLIQAAKEDHFVWGQNLLHLTLARSMFPMELLPRKLRSLNLYSSVSTSRYFPYSFSRGDSSLRIHSEFPWLIYFPLLSSLTIGDSLPSIFDHLFSKEAPLNQNATEFVSSLSSLPLVLSPSEQSEIGLLHPQIQKLTMNFPNGLDDAKYTLYASQFASIELNHHLTSPPPSRVAMFPKTKRLIQSGYGYDTACSFPPSLTFLHRRQITRAADLPSTLTVLFTTTLIGLPLPPRLQTFNLTNPISSETAAALPSTLTSISVNFGPLSSEKVDEAAQIWHHVATRLPLLKYLAIDVPPIGMPQPTPLSAKKLETFHVSASSTQPAPAQEWLSTLLDPNISPLPKSLSFLKLFFSIPGLHYSVLALLPPNLKHFQGDGFTVDPAAVLPIAASHLKDASLAHILALIPPALLTFDVDGNAMAEDPVQLLTALPRSLNHLRWISHGEQLKKLIDSDDSNASQIAAALPPLLSSFDLIGSTFPQTMLEYEYFTLHPERYRPVERPDKAFADFY